MNKYLDLDGLSHFWNKAKEYQNNKIDQSYDSISENAQSGKAVAEVLETKADLELFALYLVVSDIQDLQEISVADYKIRYINVTREIIDKVTNTRLPIGSYICLRFPDQHKTAILLSITNNATYTLERTLNFDYKITSNKDITDDGNYFTNKTIDGALQEIGSQLDGLETLLASI